MTSEDLQEGINSFYDQGDEEGVRWDDEDAHGTSKQRINAFLRGYNKTVDMCLDSDKIAEISNVDENATPEATPKN